MIKSILATIVLSIYLYTGINIIYTMYNVTNAYYEHYLINYYHYIYANI